MQISAYMRATRRGVSQQTVAVGVLADRLEDLAHRLARSAASIGRSRRTAALRAAVGRPSMRFTVVGGGHRRLASDGCARPARLAVVATSRSSMTARRPRSVRVSPVPGQGPKISADSVLAVRAMAPGATRSSAAVDLGVDACAATSSRTSTPEASSRSWPAAEEHLAGDWPSRCGPSASLMPYSVTMAAGDGGARARCRRRRRWWARRRPAPRRCGRPSSIGQLVDELARAYGVLVLGGQRSVQPSARPRDTIEILWIGSVLGQHVADERVAALVVGDDRLLRSDMTGFLRSGPAITRSMASSHLAMADVLAGRRAGEQRGLVHEVGEVGAGEARGAAGEHVEVDTSAVERLALGVHVEDRLAALEVGAVDDDLAVEAPGPQQRRVEDVGPVGGRDAGSRPRSASKPSISTSSWLSVCSRSSWPPPRPAPRWRPTASISSTKTIAGAAVLGLLEQVADAAAPDADEHLDEVGAARSRRTARRPRRPPPGRAASCRCRAGRRAARPWGSWRRGLERARGLEELLDLLELLDRLVGTGDVGEGDLRLVLAGAAGLGPTERHRPGRRPASAGRTRGTHR